MPAYVVVEVTVNDSETYAEYRPLAAAAVEKYGGRYIVRGGAVTPLEGGWQPERFVIIEFPSVAQAQAWYHSPDYQPAAALRHRAADSKMLVVEGLG
jgi:uncharacterized protein (DUF1330 family)